MIKHGIPVYDGIVMGKARLYRQWRFDPDSLHESEDAAERTQAYQAAVERAQGELELIRASLSAAPEKAKIIDAHMLLLQDFAMDDMIRADIAAGKTAASAIGDTYDMFIGVLGDTDNDFTQQKVSDLYDVRGRLLRCLAGEEDRDLSRLPGPCVIFAKDLYPTDTATIDRKNVLAIVTETGNMTSHTAILARSFGITTVLGVEGVTELVEDGDPVAVDGTAGTVCIRPDEKEQAEYLARTAQAEEAQNRRLYYMGRPSVTADGVRVLTELNISAVDDTDEQALASCDGVGLMRSEFLYMRSKDALPDEEWQFREYKAALDALGGKSLILRTLDIGGDKQLECLPLPKEDNPFLGVRALRLCFERPEIFRTQLRAALRASAYPLQPGYKARRDDRDTLRRADGGRAGRRSRLRQHRHQRSVPVHPGRRPHERAHRPVLPELRPRGPAAHTLRGAGVFEGREAYGRLRRDGGRGRCGGRARRSRHKDAEHGSRKHARGKGNARLAQLRRRKGARRRRVCRRLRRGGPVHP